MIWHSNSLENVEAELKTNLKTGLNEEEASARLIKITQKIKKKSTNENYFDILFTEIKKPIYTYLIVAVALTVIFHFVFDVLTLFEPLMLLALTLLKANIHTASLIITKKGLDKLSIEENTSIKVLRNGEIKNISSKTLVPGDVIYLESGVHIPADARLIAVNSLHCDEFALTGDSVPVPKDSTSLPDEIATIQERTNMVFAGCNVISGSGIAVVTEILDYTENSKITKIESDKEVEYLPIEARFSQLTKLINIALVAVFAIAFIVSFVAGLINVEHSHIFFNSLMNSALLIAALIIAFTPDTVKIISKFALYFGILRMKSEGIDVYNPQTIKKISDIDVICTDKTGILTENKMVLTRIFNGTNEINVSSDTVDGEFKMILRIAALCCDGEVELVNGISTHHGDATQTAIIAASMEHLGLSKYDLDNIYPRMATTPFDPNHKLMATLNVIDGKNYIIVRGAVEELIPKCVNNCDNFKEWAEIMRTDALRVVGVAMKQVDETSSELSFDFSETGLTFIGLLGLADMPRVDSRKAVIACQKAGIKVSMFTSDSNTVAYAFARKLKIANNENQILNGAEIDRLNDNELSEIINNYTVFSQLDASQRARIVNIYKFLGLKTAVTGDNTVNTESLRTADVSYSMGKSGSDSAICESEIVIHDDSFSTVVASIKSCRGIYNNIAKAVKMLFSASIGIIISIILGNIIFGASIFTNCEILLLSCVGVLLTTIAFSAENFSKRDINTVLVNDYGIFNINFLFDVIFNAAIYLICGIVSYSVAIGLQNISPSSFAFTSVMISIMITSLVFRRRGGIISFKTDNKLLFIVLIIQLLILIVLNVFSIGKFATISFVGWIYLILINTVTLLVSIAIKLIRKR